MVRMSDEVRDDGTHSEPYANEASLIHTMLVRTMSTYSVVQPLLKPDSGYGLD